MGARDFLREWLSVKQELVGATERTFYPYLARFLSGLLGFPERRIRQEVREGEGYPDLVLLDPEGDPWLLVEFKPDDAHLTDPERRRELWEDKRKYLGGMARGMLFVTPRWLWARDPRGEAPDPRLEEPLDLSGWSAEDLRKRFAFWSWEQATHERRWEAYLKGELPYGYIRASDSNGAARLREDLRRSFEELFQAARGALDAMEGRWKEAELSSLYGVKRSSVLFITF